MTHPTTPDQGDERRALSILATFVHETWAGAYSWSELEHKARTALERAGLLSLQDVLALSAALAAPQPSQGAQPVVDQKPASMSDNGSCGSQVSGKPVAQEARVKVGGSTVYVVNNHRRESNRWWATVYPGFDDDDKRVSTEECDAIANWIADALNATPQPPVSAEAGKVEPVADEPYHWIWSFLDGSAGYMGVWFGDKHPDHQGKYWWRPFLKQALAELKASRPTQQALSYDSLFRMIRAFGYTTRDQTHDIVEAILAAAGGGEK